MTKVPRQNKLESLAPIVTYKIPTTTPMLACPLVRYATYPSP